MALYNLPNFAALLPPGARLIGLDPGARLIGVALSDVNRQIASPYATLPRARLGQNAAAVADIAAREGAGGLVIGLPLDMGQNWGPRAQAARDWAHALSAAARLPAMMMDESLSTAETHERLIAAGLSRARRAALVDRLAAAEILQRALDRLRA
ncbi:Holliday junction resolvase RuvX [Acidocella sp.]|uniref:Holliday junction resolvase RuvX n=1 Tax=Acidocella sp. TaxID=50710 RepID=UPI00263790AC|nr:Holliday junction resolvase RuvX [Acidocella sp.]